MQVPVIVVSSIYSYAKRGSKGKVIAVKRDYLNKLKLMFQVQLESGNTAWFRHHELAAGSGNLSILGTLIEG